jgi:DNA polymerase III epsilon subunit family exonuclease
MELHTLPFVVVDVETTGGQPGGADRVTEVAAVHVDDDRVELAFHSLVNPERPIPWHITRLTGIDDAMVRGAPTFRDLAGEFAAHLVGRVFVAHNASFDFGFLSAEFARVAPTPLGELLLAQLCTVRLSRKLLSHLPRRNLERVSQHYGVTIEDRHRASGDGSPRPMLLPRAAAAPRVCIYLGDLDVLLGAHAGEAVAGVPTSSDGAEERSAAARAGAGGARQRYFDACPHHPLHQSRLLGNTHPRIAGRRPAPDGGAMFGVAQDALGETGSRPTRRTHRARDEVLARRTS